MNPLRSGRSKRLPVPGPIIGLAVLLVAAITFRLTRTGEVPRQHPEPRQGVTADSVLDSSRYAAYPRVAEVYAEAAQIPGVLDGLYCYCDCSRNLGHRSLLTCFQSDHAAGCDICLDEAHTAFLMSQEGQSLAAIRAVIDREFAPSTS